MNRCRFEIGFILANDLAECGLMQVKKKFCYLIYFGGSGGGSSNGRAATCYLLTTQLCCRHKFRNYSFLGFMEESHRKGKCPDQTFWNFGVNKSDNQRFCTLNEIRESTEVEALTLNGVVHIYVATKTRHWPIMIGSIFNQAKLVIDSFLETCISYSHN